MTAPDPARTARWLSALFGAGVLLQRFAVPGTRIAALLPVMALWVAFALLHGVVVVNRRRLVLFCVAMAGTGAVILLQEIWLPGRFVSLPSWALVFATSFPFVFSLADRRLVTFLRTLRHVVGWGLGLAAGCLLMTATQAVGLSWRDVVAQVFPSSFLLPDFVISYPYSYGSALYRANAWIGLEPSFVSLQLGLALVAAVLLGRSWTTLGVLVAAMVSTAAGSGFLIAVVAVVVVLGWPRREVLRRLVVPGAVGLALLAVSPFGSVLLGRIGEVARSGSSASLRVVEPYALLWDPWTADLATTLLGAGPGSSQELVARTGILGLLVPTPLKVFFDYGVLGGALLAAFLVACYLGASSRTLAATLFVSLWLIQPGLTTTVLVVNVVVLVSLWSPQTGVRLEEVVTRSSSITRLRPRRSAPPRAPVPGPAPLDGIGTR